jgi:hypothetical protein
MMMMDLQTRSTTWTIPAKIITLAWKMTMLVIHTATGVEPKRFGKRLWCIGMDFNATIRGAKTMLKGVILALALNTLCIKMETLC